MNAVPPHLIRRIGWMIAPLCAAAATLLLTCSAGVAWAQPAESAPAKSTDARSAEKEPEKPAGPPMVIDHVAGHGGQIWIVRREASEPADGRFEVLHRAQIDGGQTIFRMMEGQGQVIGAASWGRTLWILYSDRSVQAVRYRPADRSMPRTREVVQQPPLPAGGEVIGWTANAGGPIALVKMPDDAPAPEEQPDADSTPAPDTENAPESPADDAAPDGEANGETDGGESSDASTPRSPLRLIRLGSSGWTDVPLPTWVRPDLARRVVPAGDHGIALISDHMPAQAFTAHVYRDGAWTDHSYPKELSESVAVVSVGGDLFVTFPDPPKAFWRLVPHLALNGQLRDLGAINIRREADRWWVVSGDKAIVVLDWIEADGSLAWAVRGVNDDEQKPLQMTPLKVSDPPAVLPQPMTIVMIAALVIGMLFMLGGSRREPPAVVLVPRGTRPAGVVRGVAAAIDLAPPVAVSMYLHGIYNPVELLTNWMDQPEQWRLLAPWLLAVCLFVVHTTVTELFTQATLGKLLLRVRVIGLDGRPPNLWQVLVRNLFKALELMPPFPLLLLPILSRYHQRLGDMVARTLVVGPDPDAERRRKEEEDELFRDDDEDDDARY